MKVADIVNFIDDPILMVDSTKCIVFGTRFTEFHSCYDLVFAYSNSGKPLCCWDLASLCKRKKVVSFLVEGRTGNAFLSHCVKQKNTLFVRLYPVPDPRYKPVFSNHYFCSLLCGKQKGNLEFLPNFIKRIFNLKGAFLIERDRDDFSKFAFYIYQTNNYPLAFSVLWNGKLLHVISPYKRKEARFMLVLEGIESILPAQVMDIIEALDIINTTNKDDSFREPFISEGELEILTDRELEIFNYIVKGKRVREIAKELNISVNTVKNHIKNILSKLDCRNRIELIIRYYKH